MKILLDQNHHSSRQAFARLASIVNPNTEQFSFHNSKPCNPLTQEESLPRATRWQQSSIVGKRDEGQKLQFKGGKEGDHTPGHSQTENDAKGEHKASLRALEGVNDTRVRDVFAVAVSATDVDTTAAAVI